MSLIVARTALIFQGRQPSRWERSVERQCTSLFCGHCGCRLAHLPQDSATVAVKAGTLDDCSWLQPAAQMWLDEAQPWQFGSPAGLRYPRGPDEYQEVSDSFQCLLRTLQP